MKTAEIQKAIGKEMILRGHFPVAENMTAYTGGEADVMSMTKTGYVWEFEVKVSLSDFRADFKKKMKHDYLSRGHAYTVNYFVYACPKGLIPLSRVPSYAGLYYITPDGIEVVKKPPLLHKSKHDKRSIVEKCLRTMSERHFLGSALLTYKNQEIKNKYHESSNWSNHSAMRNTLIDSSSSNRSEMEPDAPIFPGPSRTRPVKLFYFDQ